MRQQLARFAPGEIICHRLYDYRGVVVDVDAVFSGDDDWYEGHIAIRNDSDPAQLDFVIDDCLCRYKGMTSQAIYRWNGDALEVSAPTPGDPRPEQFHASSGQMMRLLRRNP